MKTLAENTLFFSDIKASDTHFNDSLELAAFQLHKDALLHAALESTLTRVKTKLDYYYKEGFFTSDEPYLRSLQALEIALDQTLAFYAEGMA